MSTKVSLIVFLTALGLAIIGSVLGHLLPWSGQVTAATIGPSGVAIVQLGFFGLFCIMCFAVVPLAVRFFIAMQIRIGNGDFVLVKFFSAHEREVVYAFWALIVLGFGIIYVLAKDEVSRSLK